MSALILEFEAQWNGYGKLRLLMNISLGSSARVNGQHQVM
jgi:hypothetical protein